MIDAEDDLTSLLIFHLSVSDVGPDVVYEAKHVLWCSDHRLRSSYYYIP